MKFIMVGFCAIWQFWLRVCVTSGTIRDVFWEQLAVDKVPRESCGGDT